MVKVGYEFSIISVYIAILDILIRRGDIDIRDYEEKYFYPKHIDAIKPHVSQFVIGALSECFTLSDYDVGEDESFIQHAERIRNLLLDYLEMQYSPSDIFSILSDIKAD